MVAITAASAPIAAAAPPPAPPATAAMPPASRPADQEVMRKQCTNNYSLKN